MLIIFLLFGLIIGSFLNAVVYRLEAVESLMERSHCPHCKKKVRWFDNIPVVSFLILSARCRDCGEKISWQYPVVEIMVGLMFALLGKLFFDSSDFSSWLLTAYYLFVFSVLAVIFMYDLKYMEIPMLILWIGVAGSLMYFMYVDWSFLGMFESIWSSRTISGVLGAFVAGGFFFVLASYSREVWMGYGDAYLGILVGLIVGWPNVWLAMMMAFVIGAIISVAMIAFRKKTMKSQVPFAPFLITGTFLVVVLPQIFPFFNFLFSF